MGGHPSRNKGDEYDAGDQCDLICAHLVLLLFGVAALGKVGSAVLR